ncbi:alpha/beta hydrolase [Pedobacter arcticus]|uniref:alpha/beta hydrolase n=1 Tax=Pedobacter arcticus TaxID=752140 RepID=UPI0003643456|nr:alpha/beta hydrolase [Pedobacter arcticus]
MNIKHILTLVVTFFSLTVFSQEKVILLYPNGVPNAKQVPVDYIEEFSKDQIRFVSEPTITAYLPAKDKATGTAVVICPGGGYGFLSITKEGTAIAKKFNENGIAAFVLKYRLPSDLIMLDKTIGPLQDGQRAIQLIRERSAEWNVDPAKIGVIGFSAGGHLASTIATHFDKFLIANPKNTSVRPDFALLLYPVITFGEYAHRGSISKLLGLNPSQELLNLYSNEQQVTPTTPPVFLVHAQNDKIVSIENSLLFYQALLKNKVKAEMHLYQAGGHGFGLNNKSTPDEWFERCLNFLKQNNF